MAVTLNAPAGDSELTYASFPIIRVEKDENGNVIVFGIATDGSIDSDEQIVDSDFSGKALDEWISSGGNVRMSHDPTRPVGKGLQVEVNKDGDGKHWVKSKIVDPVAQKLVEEGVLQAYSVGIARPVIMRDSKARGGRIVNGKIVELSIVDRPANYNAKFQLVKAAKDGTPEFTGKVWGADMLTKTEGDTVNVNLPADVRLSFTPNDLARVLAKRNGLAPQVTKGVLNTAQRKKIPRGDFAYVDSQGGTHLPIHDESHVRNAMSRFNQTHFESPEKKRKAAGKILSRARKMGIDVDENSGISQSRKKSAEDAELLKQIAELRAIKAGKFDPDNDGDDDATPEGDTDHDYWTEGGKQKKPVPGKPMKKKGQMHFNDHDDDDVDAEGDSDIDGQEDDDNVPAPSSPQGKGSWLPDEIKTAMRHKNIGIPLNLGMIHDFTCPAYDPAEVVKAHPSGGFQSIDGTYWQQEALRMAGNGSLTEAKIASKMWEYSQTLRATDPSITLSARQELHKAFQDANPGPGHAPQPSSQIKPGSYNRPYVSSDHAATSPGAESPNSAHVPTENMRGSQYDRAPITSGHASYSPSYQTRGIGIEPPENTGNIQQTSFGNVPQSNVTQAMTAMHDHIAGMFPDICAMKPSDGSEYRNAVPTPSGSPSAGTPTGGSTASKGLPPEQSFSSVGSAVPSPSGSPDNDSAGPNKAKPKKGKVNPGKTVPAYKGDGEPDDDDEKDDNVAEADVEKTATATKPESQSIDLETIIDLARQPATQPYDIDKIIDLAKSAQAAQSEGAATPNVIKKAIKSAFKSMRPVDQSSIDLETLLELSRPPQQQIDIDKIIELARQPAQQPYDLDKIIELAKQANAVQGQGVTADDLKKAIKSAFKSMRPAEQSNIDLETLLEFVRPAQPAQPQFDIEKLIELTRAPQQQPIDVERIFELAQKAQGQGSQIDLETIIELARGPQQQSFTPDDMKRAIKSAIRKGTATTAPATPVIDRDAIVEATQPLLERLEAQEKLLMKQEKALRKQQMQAAMAAAATPPVPVVSEGQPAHPGVTQEDIAEMVRPLYERMSVQEKFIRKQEKKLQRQQMELLEKQIAPAPEPIVIEKSEDSVLTREFLTELTNKLQSQPGVTTEAINELTAPLITRLEAQEELLRKQQDDVVLDRLNEQERLLRKAEKRQPDVAREALREATAPMMARLEAQERLIRKQEKRLRKAQESQREDLFRQQMVSGMPGQPATGRYGITKGASLSEFSVPLLDRMEAQEKLIRKQQKQLKKQQEKLATLPDIAKTVNSMAGMPDPNVTVFKGVSASPFFQTPARPGSVQAVADVAERTQAMMLSELEMQFRTSPDPAQREAAWRMITKMRGVPGKE